MIFSGLVSVSFRKLSPIEIIELVKKASLTAIEWGGDIHVPHGNVGLARSVKSLTEKAKIKVAAYGSYFYAGESEKTGLKFEDVLNSAIELNAPTIRVWAGKKGSMGPDKIYREKVIEDLKRISTFAIKHDISISLERHGNTLTDSNESCNKLLSELADFPIFFYWQPDLGKPVNYNIDGLKIVQPRLTNLHVFHWDFKDDMMVRKTLDEGKDEWLKYLECLKKEQNDHFALLEFVKEDSPEQLFSDAKILNGMLLEINF